MKKTRMVRISLGFVFVTLAVVVAIYEHIFDALPEDKVPYALVSHSEAPPTCDPEIVEKLKSEEPLHIRNGDTLSNVLKCANIPSKQVHSVIAALRKSFNPRNLKPEHEVIITTSPAETEGKKELLSLTIRPSFENEIIVSQQEDGAYKSEQKQRKIKTETKAAQGTIKSSLYMDAANLGVPGKILHEMIRVLSYQVDFQRNVQTGDGFEVMYEVQTDEESDTTIAGDLVYAALKLNGVPVYIYRYKHKNGDINYYNERGESIKRAILQTPVEGARISGKFGWRKKHPVLGYSKMHKGVDFAVPRGTPIMCAGDGVVEKAGWMGSYGKYIRVRHSNGFKTAYAHLSRFPKGIRVGKRVKQGEVIAYSGNTGRSTGPHLHYEVLKNDVQINPQSVKKIPGSSKLIGPELKDFTTKKNGMDKIYIALSGSKAGETKFAEAKRNPEILKA